MNYRTDSYNLTLQELKHWIETLPPEADDYNIVIAKIVDVDEENDEYGVLFAPVKGVSVYEDGNEILILP